MENHAKKAKNFPLNKQQILGASTKDLRENPANKLGNEESYP